MISCSWKYVFVVLRVLPAMIFLLPTDQVYSSTSSEIQWSSHLVYQENPFQENVWSGNQVTGPPDAFPPGALHKSAFRLRSRSDIGRFIVGFDQPQKATHVVIVESFLPG
ncbi:MAG: hypothetical protein ACFCUU_04205, partial [Cyclobacteriaceae bacterium]